jgi:predicted PurR-regulated permease PerM
LITAAFPRVRFGPLLAATVLTILLVWLFVRTSHIILLLFLAILISVYLGAVADSITARFLVPRGPAIGIAAVLSLSALGGLIWLVVPPVVQQTQALFQALPQHIATWDAAIGRLAERFPGFQQVYRPGENQLFIGIYNQLTDTFATLPSKAVSIGHGFINVFSVGIMGLYLALAPGLYREWLIAFFPPLHRDLVRDVLAECGQELRKWVVAQLLAMLTLAAFTAIGLYLLDVRYWLPFAIFTGAVAIVPFFGTLVSTILPAIFVLGGPGFHGLGPGMHAFLVVLLGTVIHLFESNVVIPWITANRVKLPPVLTIMSILVMAGLLGPTGLLVAVPTLVVTMVIVRRILVNRIYEGQGFRRAVRDRSLILRVPVPEGGVLTPEGPPVDPISILERAHTRRVA